jgi:neutral trehalase
MRSREGIEPLIAYQKVEDQQQLFSMLDDIVLRLVHVEMLKLFEDERGIRSKVSRFLRLIEVQSHKELDSRKNQKINFQFSVKHENDQLEETKELKKKLRQILVWVDINHGTLDLVCISLRFSITPELRTVNQEIIKTFLPSF